VRFISPPISKPKYKFEATNTEAEDITRNSKIDTKKINDHA